MQSGTWRASRVLACAMMLLAGWGCRDSRTTSPTASTTARFNGSADLDVTNASATVCGVIGATLTITENTRLSCDVVCENQTGPCIQFGRSNITLWLNGFTMTGPTAPVPECAPNPGFSPGNPGFNWDGISTAGFDHVKVRGPGMVQKFRRHGVFVFESEKAFVEQVTSHYNCYSGIFLGLANDNEIKENVSVRNGRASAAAPCGGNCISNSNDNWVHRNHYHGNGSIVAGAPTGTPNDFGVGLVGVSNNNLIEDNDIGGNVNGLLIFPTTSGNVIRRNIIAGNPPVQLSPTLTGTPVGVDIRDASPPGANTFQDNLCVSYEGATVPRPCPSFPRYSTHH